MNDTVRREHQDKLGEEFGTVYHGLWNDWAWGLLRIQEFRELFSSVTHVELLNAVTGGGFLWDVQHILWDDLMLRVSRLTDPVRSAGKDNLTVQRLPDFCEDPGLRDEVKSRVVITVRTSKTNQEGDTADVRYLKNGAAKAIRTLRAADAAPTDRVIGLSPLQIQRRFTAAAHAAGIEARLTAHSGRVGLASELTARGASTTEVMLAGNWKTSRMVAHYSAGATAERGAVAKYL